jgi:uncharacterized repeat protein (TIGR02543 family)
LTDASRDLIGNGRGQVTQADLDAFEDALDDAKDFAATSADVLLASVNNDVGDAQNAIGDALDALQAAKDALSFNNLDTSALADAVATAAAIIDSASTTIGAVANLIDTAGADPNPHPDLQAAIDDAVASKAAAEAALDALNEAREDGIDVITDPAATPADVSAAIAAIQDALDDVDTAAAALEAAKDALAAEIAANAGEAKKADPVLTGAAVTIYSDAPIPAFADFIEASVPGGFSWKAGAPAATGPYTVVFTPADRNNYKVKEVTIDVVILDKTALDAEIASADAFRTWLSSQGSSIIGNGRGQITQAKLDAFMDALDDAEDISTTPAAALLVANSGSAAAAQAAIGAATSALQTARAAMGFNSLDTDVLSDALTTASAIINDANTSIAAIEAMIDAAEATTPRTDELDDAIDALKAALSDVEDLLDDLKDKVATGNQAMIGASATQADVDAAAAAIAAAIDDLKDGFDDIADELADFDTEANGFTKGTPTVNYSGGTVWIYEGDSLPPLAAPGSDASVAGVYKWHDDAMPAAGPQKVVFVPDRTAYYNEVEFVVTVDSIDKSYLEEEIVYANNIVRWSAGKTGTGEGQIPPALITALRNAINDALDVLSKPARNVTQSEVQAAYESVRDAANAVKVTAPDGPSRQQGGQGGTVVTNATIKVTFNAKGGTFKVGGKSVKTNTITLKPGTALGKLPKPTRENYRFAGWFHTTASAKDKKASAGTKITDKVTLVAKWYRLAYVKSKGKVLKMTLGKSKKIATAKKGKKVLILGKSGKYYKIKIGKKTGYILKSKLVLQSTKYAKKKVWMLKKAKAGSKKVVKVKKNGKLTIVGATGKYYKVKYKGKSKGKTKTFTGYILKKNIKNKKSAAKKKAA